LKGDNAAFRSLYKKMANDLYFIALMMLKNAKDAENVTRFTFIQAWKYVTSFRTPTDFKRGLIRFHSERCLELLRERNPGHPEKETMLRNILNEENIEFLPSDIMQKLESRKVVCEIVEKLPDAQLLTLLLHFYILVPVADIAEIMGVTENMVKSRLHYGRLTIKYGVERHEKNVIPMSNITGLPLLYHVLREASEPSALTSERMKYIWDAVYASVKVEAVSVDISGIVQQMAQQIMDLPLKNKVIGVVGLVAVLVLIVASILVPKTWDPYAPMRPPTHAPTKPPPTPTEALREVRPPSSEKAPALPKPSKQEWRRESDRNQNTKPPKPMKQPTPTPEDIWQPDPYDPYIPDPTEPVWEDPNPEDPNGEDWPYPDWHDPNGEDPDSGDPGYEDQNQEYPEWEDPNWVEPPPTEAPKPPTATPIPTPTVSADPGNPFSTRWEGYYYCYLINCNLVGYRDITKKDLSKLDFYFQLIDFNKDGIPELCLTIPSIRSAEISPAWITYVYTFDVNQPLTKERFDRLKDGFGMDNAIIPFNAEAYGYNIYGVQSHRDKETNQVCFIFWERSLPEGPGYISEKIVKAVDGGERRIGWFEKRYHEGEESLAEYTYTEGDVRIVYNGIVDYQKDVDAFYIRHAPLPYPPLNNYRLYMSYNREDNLYTLIPPSPGEIVGLFENFKNR